MTPSKQHLINTITTVVGELNPDLAGLRPKDLGLADILITIGKNKFMILQILLMGNMLHMSLGNGTKAYQSCYYDLTKSFQNQSINLYQFIANIIS